MLHRIPGTVKKIASVSAIAFAGGAMSPGSFLRRVPGALMARGRQLLTCGFNAVSYDLGTVTTGTTTINGLNGTKQHMTNNGASTLAPPTVETTVELEVTNGASAGVFTTSGFTRVDGAHVTTNGYKFLFYVTKSKNYSYLSITPLQ